MFRRDWLKGLAGAFGLGAVAGGAVSKTPALEVQQALQNRDPNHVWRVIENPAIAYPVDRWVEEIIRFGRLAQEKSLAFNTLDSLRVSATRTSIALGDFPGVCRVSTQLAVDLPEPQLQDLSHLLTSRDTFLGEDTPRRAMRALDQLFRKVVESFGELRGWQQLQEQDYNPLLSRAGIYPQRLLSPKLVWDVDHETVMARSLAMHIYRSALSMADELRLIQEGLRQHWLSTFPLTTPTYDFFAYTPPNAYLKQEYFARELFFYGCYTGYLGNTWPQDSVVPTYLKIS